MSIPNSVTSIEPAAFNDCSSLTSVTIPNSVTSIGGWAFNGCYNLQTITLLNPVPPTCSGIETFVCEGLRDKYDVYTYATLHVPAGSKEVYSSAHEWRYFPKIKEDMEIDGRIYYAPLKVKQGTKGYTGQSIKTDERYTIYIGLQGESRINSINFNGRDVTDEVANGEICPYGLTIPKCNQAITSLYYHCVPYVRCLIG